MTTAAHAQDPAGGPAAAADAPLTIQLELAAPDLADEQRSQISALIQSEAEALGQAHGFVLIVDGTPELVMHVEISQPAGQSSVYLITSSVEFEGSTISSQQEDVCLRCTNEEVAAQSLTLLPEAIDLAHEAREQAAPPPQLPTDEPDEEAPKVDRAAPLGAVGYTGVAAAGLGLGAAIAGGVVLHRGKVLTTSPGAAALEHIDYRPPGVALLGAGLAAMVIGNVLLAVDLGVLRQRRSSARAELAGVGLTTSHGVGLAVHGRF